MLLCLTGLAASELSETDLTYAQEHLVILCGLYGELPKLPASGFITLPTIEKKTGHAGVLRPLDLIQPYRLEMGQKFANERGKDLYAFWGATIAEQLNAQFSRLGSQSKNDEGGEKIIVNVASQEYFKSVQLDALDSDVRVVDCVFQDDGKIKSVYTKRARGLMCRYLIDRRVDSLDGIREFNLEGYEYSPRASNDSTLVFNRSGAAAKRALAASKKTKASPVKKVALKAVKDEPVKKQEETDKGDNSSALRRSTRKKRKVA